MIMATISYSWKNTFDMILNSLPGQFHKDIRSPGSPGKFSNHDIVSGFLRIFIPHLRNLGGRRTLIRNVTVKLWERLRYISKGDYFNGHSDARPVQETFSLITAFIHDSADNHIPLKLSKPVSTIPWITPEIRRKNRRRNKKNAKANKTGNGKLRTKFESLRKGIKTDIKKQHDLYVNNCVGDVKANPRDFYRYINRQTKEKQ